MIDTAELKRLMEAGQFTKPLCIDYAELGLDDNTRLVAFLMHGDPDDGEYVCVDEDPRGLDVPSPRLEAIAAAVNALPALLARVEELESQLRTLKSSVHAKPFDLETRAEWVRLAKECRGYLKTCHSKHGTDWEGRKAAMDALDAIALKGLMP